MSNNPAAHWVGIARLTGHAGMDDDGVSLWLFHSQDEGLAFMRKVALDEYESQEHPNPQEWADEAYAAMLKQAEAEGATDHHYVLDIDDYRVELVLVGFHKPTPDSPKENES